MAHFIKINENDNVAVALEVLPANITIYVDDTEVTTTMEIPVGHKFALALSRSYFLLPRQPQH